MSKNAAVEQLEVQLNAVLAKLLESSKGSRCTLRMDDPSRGWKVDLVCAEAVRPGVKSLRGDGSINQRAAATVKWMEKHKRDLVQSDLSKADPPPPAALLQVYAATAQMLGPILTKDGALSGWISVHYVDGPREWSAKDVAALDAARAEVHRLTGVK